MPLSTHSLQFRVHTRVLLTLVIAAAALWCLWSSNSNASSHTAASHDTAPMQSAALAPHTPRHLRARDLPPADARANETAAPADHLLFLQ